MTTYEKYARYMLPAVAKGVSPIVVDRAAGTRVWDDAGREYLDCFSGIAVVNAGHNHPRVLAAAQAQMQKLVHCCSYLYPTAPVADLAEQLAAITPGGLVRSFFSNSGAEAVEGAMRLAKQATNRRELIALGYSFHGRTLGTLSVTGNYARKRNTGPYVSGVAFAMPPYCYRCPLRLTHPECGCACAETLESVIRQQTSGDVAAFIAEPVLGEGGIIVPPDEYFRISTDIVRAHGGLFICDEVQSGFGRTGQLFAIEHYGVDPEILTLAKGIADGFPLGAFMAVEEVAAAMETGDHLSTFGGNPVSCAAALESIAVIQAESLVQNSRERGIQLLGALEALRGRCETVGDVRGRGLMVGVELVTDLRTKEPNPDLAKTVREQLLKKGILIGVGGPLANVVRIQPPLCVTADDCERVSGELVKVLSG
jgi:4-aminobutyrate aminotransferase-like enzyme